jgi:hypothetical protein
VIWPNVFRKTALGLAVASVPAVFAVAGASQASADPGVCVSGPWGYVNTCVDVPRVHVPGVQVYYDGDRGPRDPQWGHNGPGRGHGHGHWR